ncbi:hypothetical protein HF319_17030 [Xanthomonas sp. Kuri4-1]
MNSAFTTSPPFSASFWRQVGHGDGFADRDLAHNRGGRALEAVRTATAARLVVAAARRSTG